jgi:hypothetical protein
VDVLGAVDGTRVVAVVPGMVVVAARPAAVVVVVATVGAAVTFVVGSVAGVTDEVVDVGDERRRVACRLVEPSGPK